MGGGTGQPIDAEARVRVREDISNCLCVEAGAGAGKTTLLVDRVAGLIERGHARVDELVVITFTEKAAAELRTRLRFRLEERASSATGVTRERVETALSAFDAAAIETIHAFAGRLLRTRPLEAGLAPELVQLDELTQKLGLDAAWSEWLAGELARGVPPLREALNVGIGLKQLGEFAAVLHEQRDLYPFAWPEVTPPDLRGLRQRILADVGELLALRGSCVNDADRGLRQIDELAERARALNAENDLDALARQIVRFPEVKKRGSQANWRPVADGKRQAEICADLGRDLEQARSALATATLVATGQWLAGFVRRYEERRRLNGQAEFQDLLVWARNLLRDNREVRRYFQEQFRYVLVDEFQDTDPLQVEIVFFLCEDGVAAAHWKDVRLAPGKLFVVGDPKQAIYRFRRADIEIYEAAKRRVLECGGRLELIVQNFRSVQPIIDWANDVFGKVIGEDPLPEYQAAFTPLVAWHPAHPELPRPPVIMLHPHETDGTTSEARRREAGCLAELALRIVDERWPVRKESAVAGASFGDVCMLMPAFTEVELYRRAFERAGVPYELGGRDFFQRQEVSDLIAGLAAIDDPTDTLHVVAALKSPLFGVTDEDLLRWQILGRASKKPLSRASYLDPPDGLGAELTESLSLLRWLHERRQELTPAQVVSELLERTKLVELALARHDGIAAAHSLLQIEDAARAFHGAGGATFRSFVRYLQENQSSPRRTVEFLGEESGGNAVRFLSMHGAKGLEFPIVVLANFGRGGNFREHYVNRETRQVFFTLGQESPFKLPGYEAEQERAKRHAKAEERRLFYVATTRARDHLVISTFLKGRFFEHLRGFVAPPDRIPFGGTFAKSHVYATHTLAAARPDPAPFKLELASAAEPDAVAAAAGEFERWRRELSEILGQFASPVESDCRSGQDVAGVAAKQTLPAEALTADDPWPEYDDGEWADFDDGSEH
ncbi:MAG: UvrD-helicase domain-containing protein [Chloroflexi bacterium]|nr:UvrD-helicase domain-containing protein [Chloroflexota bacterium]